MTVTSEKPFVIYRSSAGSGKTYTLALEYLTLALRHPTAYRSILAVTFTNKATQEMKTRIVAFLYQLAHGENETLREAVMQRTALTNEALTERAQQVLRHILHGYSYFAVMTIDSFFQKVVRAFAREMNLPAGFSIELDEGKVLEEVIDELLLALGDDQHRSLRRWLTRFAEEKVETGQSWDFRRDIRTLARELFKEDYRLQRPPELPERDMGIALKHLRAQQQQFEQQMQEYGQRALAVMERHALAVADFAYGDKGVAAYFPKLTETTNYEPGERVKKSSEDPHLWYTKSSKNKETILAAVEGGLRSLLGEALEYYQRHKQVYHSVVALSRFVYTHGILHHLEAQLQTYQRTHDLMLISDAPLFLKDIIGDEDTPFIYEKMGTTFQNFLIDEFQDTSGLQWANFRPLVANSLSAGQRNLVVGDVKQSIYRWRGGDWQLLLEKIQRDVADYQTEVRDLDRNYRSRRHIVDFNNALFARLSELLCQTVEERLAEVTDESTRQRLLRRAEVIRAAYAQSEQTLPSTYGGDWHGHVRIQLLEQEQLANEAGDDTPWKDYVKAQLPAMVERLQDQGYALHDIAFLVRNKRDGQEVAATFMDYKNQGHAREGYRYEVISPESLFLNASLTVGLLVEVLRFLDNPNDRIARGSILHRYRRLRGLPATSSAKHRGFAAAGDKDDLETFYRELPPDFRRFQEYLNKLPLYELVENLVQLFGLSSDDGPVAEAIYLQAFQDAVLNYGRAEQGDLHAFLRWWEERGKETSLQVPEAVDAMRIMTIHKAKGLQFKVVILPFCTWDTDHHPSQTNILWSSTSVSPLNELGLMPLRYDRKLADTVFDQEYYEELIRVHMDNLNLLYVAFTRAEACLYAFAAPKKNKEGYRISSVANALRQSFAAPPTSAEQIDLTSYYDEPANVLELGSVSSPWLPQRKSEPFTLSGYPSVRWRDRLMVRPTSRGYFADAAQPSALSVNLAGLLREVLVRTRHHKEADRHLQDVYYERGITQTEREQLARRVTQALNHPTLRAWYEPTGPVMVQRTLLTGQQRYVCPDRVMLPSPAAGSPAAGSPAAGSPAAGNTGTNATVVHFGLVNEQAEHRRIIRRSVATLRSLGYAEVEGYWVNTQTLTVTEVD